MDETPASAEAAERALVARAVAGDRSAFAVLLEQHYDFIYRTAYRWLGRASEAEDLAQDVCVKLATVLGRFDGRSAFRSWLYRITLNMVRDVQRSGAARHQREKDFVEVSGGDTAPADARMDDAELWRAVRALPEKQRDAVLLVYAEEMSHADAANILGVKESTISWQVHEARKTLKGLLS